ncbi:MAG: hypothetical protein RBU21_00025 [FCB group bacterium]|jgi:hypothetical protein|nr:hypothetical protein [FCB group bacterium]
MINPVTWFFSPPPPPVSPWRAWVWWELRRIPFNIIIGVYGIVCLIIFYASILSTGYLEPGEDPVEPVVLLFAPFIINALYSLGWFAELPLRVFIRKDLDAGPLLLKMGLGLGLALITIPAALWGAIRIMQLMGVRQ